MILTPEQSTVVERNLEPGQVLKVIAYAGTGKTSTFVEYANARMDSQMLYLAFNKSVQTEASERFASNVRCRTMHSLAYSVFGRSYRDKLGPMRYYDIMKRLKCDVYAATLVCKTLDNWWNSADPEITPAHAAEDELLRYKPGYEAGLAEASKTIWLEMQKDNSPFAMSHSGYLKLYQLSEPKISAEVILLDEAQDTNPVAFDIIQRQQARGARVLLCGDPNQQIYSWRGAVDAMSYIDAPTLYLTHSFRFGSNIANIANLLLSGFLDCKVPVVGHPEIEDSIVEEMPPDATYTVICRTNVEVFRQALRCVAERQSICMVGGNSFSDLVSGIREVYNLYAGRHNEVTEPQLRYFRHFQDLVEFATARLDGDLVARVNIVSEYKHEIPIHLENIQNIMTVARIAKVLVTTAHKAKGLEWNNVVLADDFVSLFDEENHPYPVHTTGIKGNQLTGVRPDSSHVKTVDRDEVNILYVAATRARLRLKLNPTLRRLVQHASR